MAALIHFVEIDQVGIGALGPGFRRLIDFPREHGHRDRDLDIPGLLFHRIEVVGVVFPVQASGGDGAVGQPIERNAIEYRNACSPDA